MRYRIVAYRESWPCWSSDREAACVNVAEGGLVDWMFNCDSREQVTACYPTTPVYADDGFGLL